VPEPAAQSAEQQQQQQQQDHVQAQPLMQRGSSSKPAAASDNTNSMTDKELLTWLRAPGNKDLLAWLRQPGHERHHLRVMLECLKEIRAVDLPARVLLGHKASMVTSVWMLWFGRPAFVLLGLLFVAFGPYSIASHQKPSRKVLWGLFTDRDVRAVSALDSQKAAHRQPGAPSETFGVCGVNRCVLCCAAQVIALVQRCLAEPIDASIRSIAQHMLQRWKWQLAGHMQVRRVAVKLAFLAHLAVLQLSKRAPVDIL
jgi:hypothetical protein